MPIGPVVVVIALVLTAAMGVSYLVSNRGQDQAAPALVASMNPAPVAVPPARQDAPAVPPVAAPAVALPPVGNQGATSVAPAANPPSAAVPAPASVAAPTLVATPAPAPTPSPAQAGPRCGPVTNPGSIAELPVGTSAADAVCVARIWIKVGRTDDAAGVLSAAAYADNAPAALELGKLYDPKSHFSNPPASADFAKDKYRKAIQKADEDSVRKEAQQRLDALVK